MVNYRTNAPDWMKKEFDMLCKRGEQCFNSSSLLTEVGTYLFLLEYYPDEALYYLKRAVEVDPTNVDAHFWLAIYLYYDMGDYVQAKEILYETIKLASTRADCLSLLAYVIRGIEGPTEECLRYLKSAIGIAPSWTLPRQVLIQIYTQEGNFELASQEIKKLSVVIENSNLLSIKVNNKIEDYYERCVTGRLSYEDNIKSLQEQIEELNRAKLACSLES